MAENMVVITGIPQLSFVNVRSGPGTNHDKVFQADVGTSDVVVLEVAPDAEDKGEGGKVYQWFRLRFPGGTEGWCRDDLLQLQPGDWRAFGYGTVSALVRGFDLKREVAETRAVSEALEALTPEAPAVPGELGAAAAESGCVGTIVSSVPANMRSGPSTKYQPPVVKVPVGEQVPVLGVVPEEDGGAFRWVKVAYQGQQGFLREDLLAYKGDCAQFDLAVAAAAATGDLFPAPMKGYTFIRGFTGAQPNHPGWDLAALEGTPMVSGPVQGYVWRAHTCTKCTSAKPNTPSHNIAIGDTSVFFDEAWGWGNGHHVIVRYMNKDLPPSTQEALAKAGMAGWHIYALYAHMEAFSVQQGHEIAPNTPIGTCGNTGNSTGAHLHLEIRAFAQATNGPLGYSNMKLLDPVILFSR